MDELNQFRCVEPSTEFSDFQRMLSRMVDGQGKLASIFVISLPENDTDLLMPNSCFTGKPLDTE